MKLPTSLTTITPFSRILALLMFITFPIVGFYIGMQYQKALDVYLSYPSQVNTVTKQDATTIKIDMSSIGKIMYARVADTVVVALPATFTWGISVLPEDILQEALVGSASTDAQRSYKAVKEGTVTITANGRPQCLKGHLCSMLAIPFKTQIIVSK